MTVVTIHQPNYFPWLGFFEKAMASKTFIILDHVQHVRQSLTRRTYLRKNIGSTERALMSIPLQEHSSRAPINALKIKGTEWITDHLNKIDSLYKSTPFYREVREDILSRLTLCKDGDLLSELNYELVRRCCVYIGITTNFRLSSRMDCSSAGSALMAELTEMENGSAYYSGGGASGYTDENDFGARGLAISYQQFAEYTRDISYQQGQGEWLPGLSIIDALCNIGPVATEQYLRNYAAWRNSRPLEQDDDPMAGASPSPLY